MMTFDDEKLMAVAKLCGIKGDLHQIKHFSLIIGGSRDHNLFDAIQRLKRVSALSSKSKHKVIDACLDTIESEHIAIDNQKIAHVECTNDE